MTKDEAVQVVMAISTADGGCSYCFEQLLKDLRIRMPDAPWREALFEALLDWDNREALWKDSTP